MKKFFIQLLLILTLAFNVSATNYYFDLASGNDSTGDGSAGNPWKTIDKCTTSRSAGDECRGALTAITTLDGTLTFTNGSTTVNTSSDLTAVVAAGDLVGKNSGLEGWWRVASRDATTITLAYQYWGLSGSGSAVTGYKITPVAASEEQDVNSSGSSSAYLKVSGGWNLSNTTQEGYTAYSFGSGNCFDFNSKTWVEVEKFMFVLTAGAYAIYLNHYTKNYIHNCFISSAITGIASLTDTTIKDVVLTGGIGNGVTGIGQNNILENVYCFSPGNGSTDYSFSFVGCLNYLLNCRVYNSYGPAFYFATESGVIFLVNCISDTVISGDNVEINGYSPGITFYNFTASGASAYVCDTYYGEVKFIESSLTAGGSGTFYLSSSYQQALNAAHTYKPIGGDSQQVFYDGIIEHDSSADCRSGNCIKFDSSSATYPLITKVGNVKIPSAGSALTVSAYLKDDADFNGTVNFLVVRNGKWISKTAKTPTTSYVKESVVVATGDLVADDYIDLYVIVSGTAGNVWIDDFSAEQ